MSATRLALVPIGLAAAVLLGACGDGSGPTGGGTTVMATTSILGDIVHQVAGDCVAVDVLVPAGTDPHEFEPSARAAADVRRAAFVATFGSGLEGAARAVLDAAAGDGVPVVDVTEGLELLALGTGRGGGRPDGREAGGGKQDGRPDPHVWQDPRRIADAVPSLIEPLVDEAGCDRAGVERRAAAYADELRRLDEEVAARYASVPDDRRGIVTTHAAFGYLADRFGLEIVGTIAPGDDPEVEPSPRHLAELVDDMERRGVVAVITEATGSDDLARSIAREVDPPAAVVELHSDALGGPGSGAETYVDLVRTNADRLVSALTSGGER